jgi:ComF family protein
MPAYLAGMIREMLDLMMPRECLVCGRQLGAAEEHLCIWCAEDLPLTYFWEQAHNPMADQFNALLERHRPPGVYLDYAYAAALLYYHHENPYKTIPQALKYRYDIQAGRYFSARLGRLMALYPHFASVDLVIPVPLHWTRLWRRGYNQAEVIAAELARALDARLCTDILVRRTRTRTQTRLDADARMQNVQGVFQIRKTLDTSHILLVDDTFTTGATLAACHQLVREAFGQPVRISISTLAVVQD